MALGGAVGDVDPSGSAFPWRKQSAVVQWYVETSIATQWVSAAHQEVQPYSVDPNRIVFYCDQPAARKPKCTVANPVLSEV